MAQLTYGDNEAYTVEVPEAVLVKLAQRTYAHIMGNEAASALKSKKDNGDVGPDAGEEWLHTWRVTKAEQVRTGQIGMRVGGPRKDPIEKEMQEEAIRRLKAAVKNMRDANGEKVELPTKMDGPFTFADGTVLTLRNMIDRKLTREADDIRATAQRIIRERERGAKKVPTEPVKNEMAALGI